MQPLRIVLLMVEPPLPFGNAVGRWYYVLLKGLVQRGHQVTAFATCSNPKDIAAAEALFPTPQFSLRCYEPAKRSSIPSKWLAFRRPHAYLFSPELQRDFTAELKRGCDIVHLEALWGGWLAAEYRRQTVVNVHYLLQIEQAGEPAGSMLDWARKIRTRQAENHLLRKYRFLCTVSPRLTAFVQQRNPAAEVHTVPLSFDISRYDFELSSSDGPPVVGLIGSFDWQPSYSAGKRLLEKLWPEIHRRVPQARLQIVGRRALTVFGEYANVPGISIYQDVPDTMPYFRKTSVLLYAPVRGSGVKVKVLEAFALGVPVVTTEDGVEGIAAVNGVHALICKNNKELVDQTVALLGNRESRRQQSLAARTFVEEHFHPDVALDAMEHVYQRVMGQQQR